MKFFIIWYSAFLLDFVKSYDEETDNYDWIPPTFDDEVLENYGHIGWNKFRKIYKDIEVSMNLNMKRKLEEYYRALKRDCFTHGKCRIRDEESRTRAAGKSFNTWDEDGTCPDSVDGLLASNLNFPTNGDATISGQTVILDKSISIDGILTIDDGKLIFQDNGKMSDRIVLRAKAIQIGDGGELWIGSRKCRFEGNADIVLFGNREDMEENHHVGTKYLWVSTGGVLEMHGKEKLSWTHLNEHIFRDNVPAEQLHMQQDKQSDEPIGNRLVFYILSAEGDLKETMSVLNGESIQPVADFIESQNEDEIFIFMSDFVYHLTEELKNFLTPFGFDASQLDSLLSDEDSRKYSQIGGVFKKNGESDLISISPTDGVYHEGLKGTVGPVSLAGEKTGFQFSAEIRNNWQFYNPEWVGRPIITMEKLEEFLAAGFDSFTARFQNNLSQNIVFSGPRAGSDDTVLTLSENVSSWEVGDRIVVASTDWDARQSEVFTIVSCAQCQPNQLKVDRPPTHTHWGRIDSRTGVDQRAEVGLLSRNVRFYGEMSSNTCQYALTRESLDLESPNHNKNWCFYFNQIEGQDRDMHGAHMIATYGFKNMHMSHVEIFNAGQPRLARYPVHWHHAGYVGVKGGYQDPSSVQSLSIHRSFSRFVTVHATHETIVQDCVGYDGVGHGYFLEDGYETENHIVGNLGISVKPGIILPSDRDGIIDGMTGDGYMNQNTTLGIRGLSVFWISNLNNYIHDNAAVGGHAGFWSFSHTASASYRYETIPRDPVSGKREWRNNKASACSRGFVMDESVMDQLPSAKYKVPQFSLGVEWKLTLKSLNDDVGTRPNFWARPEGNWARLEMNGWKIHHTNEKNWGRNADVHHDNWQMSDNSRSFIIKAASSTDGASKSFTNSVFVGMSKNTGHKLCIHDYENGINSADSFDLTSIRQCVNSLDGPARLDQLTPRMNTNHADQLFWFKVKGDVYRVGGKHQFYPYQGIAIYDTWLPTVMENLTFYDFYSEEGDAHRHAIGAHLGNLFQISIKNCYMKNMTFDNVARKVQWAEIESNVIGGDKNTVYGNWGSDYAQLYRDLGDGEKTVGLVDLDGLFSNGEPAYLIANENTNINTGCSLLSSGEAEGLSNPGVKVCPLTTQIALISIDIKSTVVDPNFGLQAVVQTMGEEGSMVMSSNVRATTGKRRANVEAFKTHAVTWTGSPPPTDLVVELNDADHLSWYRLSFCIGTASVKGIMNGRRFPLGNDMTGFTKIIDGAQMATFEDLVNSDQDGFFVQDGWVHLKLFQTEDRRKGGIFTDEDGAEYQVSDSLGWEFSSLGLGSVFRSNIPAGIHMFKIVLDKNSLSGVAECLPFDEPTTTTTTTTTTTKESYWGEWENEGECSASCGGGEQVQVRQCNGDSCDGDAQQIIECNIQQCSSIWGEWTDEGECSASCGEDGVKSQVRTCETGDNCVGDARQTVECNRVTCPRWGEWTDSGDCSATCGDEGVKTQTRECETGDDCIGENAQTVECNRRECVGWGDWTDDGECSATCGSEGMVAQSRQCLSGDNCNGDSTRTIACNRDIQCEAVWGEWEDQGECSATCGSGGVIAQSRTCTTGDNCRGVSERTQPCNRGQCVSAYQSASVDIATTVAWSDSLNDPESDEYQTLANDIQSGLAEVVAETGAEITSVTFQAEEARRRRDANGKKAVANIEMEIPIHEDDEVEGKELEDIGKELVETVRAKIDQKIKAGKFGNVDEKTEPKATPKDAPRRPEPEGKSPCPSKECWVYASKTGKCVLKDGCTAVTCADTEKIISFIPALFGGNVDDVIPAPGEVTDIEINEKSVKGYEIRCGLGECEMSYSAADGLLTFATQLKKEGAGNQDFDGVSIRTGIRDISIKITCEYAMEFTVSSDKFNIMDVTTSGSVVGEGSLATGFALSLNGGDEILLGAMMDVTASWAVKTLPDIVYYFTACVVVQDETSVTLIESGCFSKALHVSPTASDDATKVGFSFKTFMVGGASTNDQTIKCTIHLCKDACSDKPTDDAQCPQEEEKSAYDFSVEGYVMQ